jgi:glucokinase
VAGHAIATALTLIDGVVVIGGGIAGASKYILPALMKELREDTGMTDGTRFPRLQMKAYNLENPEESKAFLKTADRYVKVPESQKEVAYQTERRTGVILSRLGASRAIALGAYWLAVSELRKKNN